MKHKNRILCNLLILGLILMLTGCLGGGSSRTALNPGSVLITIPIPKNISLASTDYPIEFRTIEVILSKAGQSRQKEFEVDDDEIKVSFEKLKLGNWDIAVKVKDADGLTLYSGGTKVNIKSGEKTTAYVQMHPNQGFFKFKFILPENRQAKKAELYIRYPGHAMNFGIIDVDGPTLVWEDSFDVGTWPVHIDLYDEDDNLIYAWNSAITIRPGRQDEYEIDLNEFQYGEEDGLELEFEWKVPPEKVRNVTAHFEGDKVNINWDENPEDDIVGYRVFRSTESGGTLTSLNNGVLTNPEYVDWDVRSNTTYWYYVIAYSDINLGSTLSDPANVSVTCDYLECDIRSPIGMSIDGVAATGTPDDFRRAPNINGFFSSSPNILEYHLYRSIEDTNSFTYLAKAKYNFGHWSVVDYDVSWGITHYYYLIAVDEYGEKSAPSDIMSFKLAPQIEVTKPAIDSSFELGDTLVINWDSEFAFDEYNITVFRYRESGYPGSTVYKQVYSGAEYEILLDEALFYPGRYGVYVSYAGTRIDDLNIIASNSNAVYFDIVEE